MKRCSRLALLFFAFIPGILHAQWSTDVLGSHDLSPGGASPIKGRLNSGCQYCHAPHSGITMGTAPLWSQTLSKQTYTTYTSPTLKNPTTQTALGGDSNLCLSCHDGTVAPGQSVPYGRLRMTGTMLPQDKFGTNLSGSHPFSFTKLATDS